MKNFFCISLFFGKFNSAFMKTTGKIERKNKMEKRKIEAKEEAKRSY